MEKKRSFGIWFLGILAFVNAILLYSTLLPRFFGVIFYPLLNNRWANVLNYLYMLGWILAGIGILTFKRWGRILAITLATMGIAGTVYGYWIFPIIYKLRVKSEPIIDIIIILGTLFHYGLFIIYFNRPKVKAQFSPPKAENS